jgi:uncharacterized protein YbjT (DUF2867 family)
MFLLRPPAISDVKSTLIPFIKQAKQLGVDHVVFLSVAGAEKNAWVPHHAVEQHLKQSGMRYTLLRPGFFSQNLQDAYHLDIVKNHRIFVPAGQGNVAFVDVRDVAEVAALALLSPENHSPKSYTLTGPEVVSFAKVASLLSENLSVPIRYQPASVFSYIKHLRGRKMSWGQCLVQTILHTGLRWGQADHVDPTLSILLEHPPHTMEQYIHDHLQLWEKAT